MENQSLPLNQPIDLLGLMVRSKDSIGLQSIIRKVYQKQERIYEVGQEANKVYIIIKGRVKVGSHTLKAKELIKHVYAHGDLFGEIALIKSASRVDFAMAMEKSELYILGLEELHLLMQFQSGLTEYIISLLGARLISTEQKIESFIFKTSRTRIIEFLHDLGRRQEQVIGFEIVIHNFFTHQEIANITATSRQSVTMVLNELKNKNILTFNRRRLLIRDLEKLRGEVG